ncbi:MarR family transcriptional regulator [Streptosporangium sp. NBC_01639]|uniref:MarR family winged helix-turn-helix transcriptional regulator n=1 Tax=unclassified Streptosporangium TaxID=2632669 RepID=UPI002DD8BD69|nr:MarR family transcriptional regulator [Streptosporangium sp. NBC_01756]WSC84967.1 MarR family transcriptional regulator [Streptosporangium sp. NBC_01756]WTD56394.1 MarR family transcriptional regulator [Streptosporangium sp. NBC_01639]
MDSVEKVLHEWRRERPDLDASPIGVFARLRQAAEMSRHELEAYLAPFGLTPKSFDVLANLRRGGAPYRKTPSQLAESSLLSSGAMTGRLDGLEGQGLIRRTPHPTDRRVMYAELTDAGIKLIDEAFAVHLANEEALLGDLSPEDRARIADALSVLEESMRAAQNRRR